MLKTWEKERKNILECVSKEIEDGLLLFIKTVVGHLKLNV